MTGQSQKRVDGGRIAGPQNVPSVVEVKCQVQLANGKLSFFTVHGSYTQIPPNFQTLANALFTSIGATWNAQLSTWMSDQTKFQFVIVRDMTDFHLAAYTSVGAPIAGQSPSAAMPSSNAIVLTEEIVQRGRGMKGRIFMGGWSANADEGGGIVTGDVQIALNTFGTALMQALTAQNLKPCVAQVARQEYFGITGTHHAARLASHVDVTSIICRDAVWDTQRRRQQ